MNLLVFEYATALGVKDPSLTAEGQAMLNAITNDLDGLDTNFIISKDSVQVEGETVAV
ncbi:hypothetical protein [Methanobacterium petrolearium]|uniref:hypothetical protein n=1 Tax=Methanobacterium petrolearium TaxID=710190 RepID=UPI003081F9B5|nr:hypothetical protein GCM10025861_15730 [Methanobacterium petrolearium]